MTKLHDFRIMVRKAEFADKMVSVPYGCTEDVFLEQSIEATLPDAIAQLARLSGLEPRSHAASLSLKYRDDPKPRGFDKAARVIYFESAETLTYSTT